MIIGTTSLSPDCNDHHSELSSVMALSLSLPVASGFVLGEGTMSVVSAIFMAAGIPPLYR
jgi:hypothetical protein